MENERILNLKSFRSGCYRLFTWKYYIVQLFITLCIAIASPYVLQKFCDAFKMLDQKVADSFKIGTVYNIGIITVKKLDIDSLSICDIVTGVFSGSVAQCMITAVVITFLIGEYRNGYVFLAITKGHNRITLFIKYCLISMLGIIPICFIYVIGIGISACLVKNEEIRTLFVDKHVTLILLDQFIMIVSIVFCAVAITFLIRDIKSLIIIETGLLMVPFVPVYIKIFTDGFVNLEKFSLLSRLIKTGECGAEFIVSDIFVAIVTTCVFCIVSMTVFFWNNIHN